MATAKDLAHEPPPPAPRRAADRQLWIALAVAALVVTPRSILIATAHSETYDAGYHLARGLAYLTRSIAARDLELNDPPLGEGLVALPLLATNLLDGRPADDDRLYDTPGRAERVALRVATWNSILVLPLFAAVFLWTRTVYGLRSAWLATAALLVDPTLAAHIPLAALDVLGVTGIVVACLLGWRYFEDPGPGRLAVVGVATGFALMLKHTAVLLPAVLVGYAGLWWVVRPRLDRVPLAEWRAALPARLRACVVLPIYVAGSIWALTLFEMVPPKPTYAATAEAPASGHRFTAIQDALRLSSPWPAGTYLRAFRSAFAHGLGGHEGYLFGERSLDGWRSYFLVAATYKVPIGLGLVLALGVASVATWPPRWGEWGLFLPLAAWSLFLINSKVNIGFRHFLPPLAFGLALASRARWAGGASGRAWRGRGSWRRASMRRECIRTTSATSTPRGTSRTWRSATAMWTGARRSSRSDAGRMGWTTAGRSASATSATPASTSPTTWEAAWR